MANCITKHIPNALTSSNLVCGCIATSFAFGGCYEKALLFIILGAVILVAAGTAVFIIILIKKKRKKTNRTA